MSSSCIDIRVNSGLGSDLTPPRSTTFHLSTLTCTVCTLVSLICMSVAALGLLASALTHSASRTYGHADTIAAEEAMEHVNGALVEMSRRMSAAAGSRYNLPSAPWLPDCSAAYTRTDDAQEHIIQVAQHMHSVAIDPASPSRAQYESELLTLLSESQDDSFNFLPVMDRWLSPELARLGFKVRPVALSCTRHALVLIVNDESQLSHLHFLASHTLFMLHSDVQRWGLVVMHLHSMGEKIVDMFEIWPGGAGENIQLHTIAAPKNGAASSSSHSTYSSSSSSDSSIPSTLDSSLLSPSLWSSFSVDTLLLLDAGSALREGALMLKPAAANIALWNELTNRFAHVGQPTKQTQTEEQTTMHRERNNAQEETTETNDATASSSSPAAASPSSPSADFCSVHLHSVSVWQRRALLDLVSRFKGSSVFSTADAWLSHQLLAKHSYRYRGRIGQLKQCSTFGVTAATMTQQENQPPELSKQNKYQLKDAFFCTGCWKQTNEETGSAVDKKHVVSLLAAVKTYYAQTNSID